MPPHWTRRIETLSGPKYLRIARAIGESVRDGTLASGDQLPPQRDLADELGVTVGTVARAYQVAGEEGWIESHVGRGTFVLGGPSTERGRAESTVDLTMNQPLDSPVRERVMRELRGRVRESDASELLLYQRGEASEDTEAAARWLGRSGRPVSSDEVLLTAGGQHGLFLAFLALCEPSDTVLTERFIYPGIRTAADALGLQLVGVASDEDGLDPDDLRGTIARTGATVACFTPVIPNPTATSWTEARFAAIAEVADDEGLRIVEDDVYRGLHPDAPDSLHSRSERTVLVSSVSKVLTPGLRVGALAAPGDVLGRLRARAQASLVMVSPLTTDAASRLLDAADLDRMLADHRERIDRRHRAAREILPDLWILSPPLGLHLWLRAPASWSGLAFVDALRRAGILTVHGSAFALARGDGEDRLRVSLGGQLGDEAFRVALETIASVGNAPPQSAGPVV